MDPLNISPSVTERSGTEDFTVNINKPIGGVRRPASMTIIPYIANAIGSKPATSAIGTNIGTVNKISDIESISAPRSNQIIVIIMIKPKGVSPVPTTSS